MSKKSSVETELEHALVTGQKLSSVCRICKSPLTIYYDGGNAAHRGIRFRCPKHGTLVEGERFLTGYRVVFGDGGAGDE